jgi:hypothetical protein
MVNGGWYGTKEEWQRMEAPIEALDPELQRFAALHSLSIERNHKDWPGRSMVWDNGVRCLIQLYLDDAESFGIDLWICASQDRGRNRYWKQEFLCKGAPSDNIERRLPELLATAKARLDDWSSHPEQLEFATEIARL